jgi:hypothetical protein
MSPGQKPCGGLVLQPARLPQHLDHPAPEHLFGDDHRRKRQRRERPGAIDNARRDQRVQMRLPVRHPPKQAFSIIGIRTQPRQHLQRVEGVARLARQRMRSPPL